MTEQVARAPLDPFERTLVDVFCKGAPCPAAMAFVALDHDNNYTNSENTRNQNAINGGDELLYEACRRVIACTSACPLRQAHDQAAA